MITVKLPDGRSLQFPDGTSRETMKGAINSLAMKERIASAKAGTMQLSPERQAQQAAIDLPVEQNMRDPGAASAFIQGAGQGATFGFADEILGGAAGAKAGLGAAMRGDFSGMGDAASQGYADMRDKARASFENAQFARPKTTLGGQVAGGFIPAVTGGGAALKAGSSLASRAGVGALVGAGEGALSGFGSGQGGIESRLGDAAKMAAIGGIGGAAAPAVFAGLGLAGKAIANPVASALNLPSNVRASAAIEKLMKRAGVTADDAQRAIDSAANDGQDVYRLADALGLSGQRGLAGIARQPGDTARQEIADFLTSRQSSQGDRLSRFISDALDAPDTAAARSAAMTTARGDAASVAYDAARKGASPVDVRGVLAAIDDRIGPMSGMGVAGDGIDNTLLSFRGRLAAPDAKLPKGASAVELSDFNRVLNVKQDISDQIGAAVRAGRNNEARELMKVQKELDAALEAASPSYRSANDSFAKASREIDAVDAGKAAVSGRVRAEDTAASWAKMTPEQQAAFRAGYADPVIARIDNSAMGTNKARPLSSGKTAADMGNIALNPEQIKRQIARENTMFETGNAALGGSKTADNMADAADMNSASMSVLGNILFGNWGAAGRQVADKAMSAGTGMNPATREIMARALLSQDPAAALAPAARRAAQMGAPKTALEALFRASILNGAQ